MALVDLHRRVICFYCLCAKERRQSWQQARINQLLVRNWSQQNALTCYERSSFLPFRRIRGRPLFCLTSPFCSAMPPETVNSCTHVKFFLHPWHHSFIVTHSSRMLLHSIREFTRELGLNNIFDCVKTHTVIQTIYARGPSDYNRLNAYVRTSKLFKNLFKTYVHTHTNLLNIFMRYKFSKLMFSCSGFPTLYTVMSQFLPHQLSDWPSAFKLNQFTFPEDLYITRHTHAQ